MLSKRIIPCLDVKNGRTVKGVNFNNLADAGNPVELAYRYYTQGADELVLLDISATLEGRETFAKVVEEVARVIAIPFTVGGGIRTINEVDKLLKAGADKVSLNTAAIQNPALISQIAEIYGSQCVVVAIDAALIEGRWVVVSHAGTQTTNLTPLEWALKSQKLGAGEILLTSYSSDGTQAGFAVELTAQLSSNLKIPVIASGGAGTKEHFLEVFTNGKADAALAAGVFHFGKIEIGELKWYLVENGLVCRENGSRK